jgi:hypothetical protein
MGDIEKVSKRHPMPLRLSEEERAIVERWATHWGVSHAVAIRRMIREYEEQHR